MTGKAKPAKHSQKELAGIQRAATQNKSGGAAGAADRKGGVAGHSKFKCPICSIQVPGQKTAEEHWESKHKKVGPFKHDDWMDTHEAAGGVTTAGVGVAGSKYKKKETKLENNKKKKEENKVV